MTTTPPPSSAIRTPPTPRYGSRYDNYEPYSPRRSKRIADQQHLFSGSAAALDASTTGLVKEHALRRDQELHQLGISGRATYSPPHSQVSSPKRSSERLDMNSPSLSPPPKNRVRSEPVSSSLPHSSSSSSYRSTMDGNTNSSLAANGMLPTPAKTPRKKQIEDLGPTARTLFSSSSKPAQDPAAMMPKRSKKYSGFSLESFEADPQQASQEPIAIFTDSRDRIPQVNNSPDNPFRSKPAEGEPSSSKLSAEAGKRRKLDESSRKRDKNVDKAIRRDDGLLYVFRGKKVFRKFKPEVEEEDDDDDLGLLASRSELKSESIPRIRPLTRSSIKPRVLFPEARAAPVPCEKEEEPSTPSTIVEAEEEQDEEPDEEPVEESAETADQPATAHAENGSSENPITPEGQIIQTDTPSSPLASGRSLRSHGLKAGSGPEHCDPDTPTAKRISPFDRWRRGKSHSTPTKTKKRGIDGNSNQTSKKSRSH